MKKSQKKGGSIWKIQLKSIKSKISYMRAHNQNWIKEKDEKKEFHICRLLAGKGGVAELRVGLDGVAELRVGLQG